MTQVASMSLFDRAARVFDGWTDPETGARVLRIFRRDNRTVSDVWQTLYHQCKCFLDGGRKVLLRTGQAYSGHGGFRFFLLDLTTGEMYDPFPVNSSVCEICDGTDIAILSKYDSKPHPMLWDLHAGRALASITISEGWSCAGIMSLGDGCRVIAAEYRGSPYDEPVQSRHYLLTPDEEPRLIFEADGYFCNHMQGCPTDPNLYSYDRWPSPKRNVDQVTYLRSLDGSIDEPAKLDEHALRPVDTFGCRDHYVWTPNGNRIVSYLCPHPIVLGPDFNHFNLEWWLSALDWHTGEDLAAKYPEGRWGCHMQITPDSKYIVSSGGPGFDYLYAVEIEGLRRGWNEHIICGYPRTVSKGKNSEPFSYPFVLPDYSGVIFNAGWQGPEHGIYLAEWPVGL